MSGPVRAPRRPRTEIEMLDRPPFIVWRAARGVPWGFMPPGLEGRWDYRREVEERAKLNGPDRSGGRAVAIRTSRIEHRDSDGASAEVWEVHPIGANYPDDPADRLPLWLARITAPGGAAIVPRRRGRRTAGPGAGAQP